MNRVDGVCRQLEELKENQARFEQSHLDLKAKLETNTELTKKIEANTAGVVDAWQAAVGGLKVLGFLGKVARWVGYILAAVAALSAYLHFGNGIRPK